METIFTKKLQPNNPTQPYVNLTASNMKAYEVGTKNIAISKSLICDDFFILSSGFAGEMLQKYINYGGRIAIYGDYSHYTSKPLHDFIYESNKGSDVFFVTTLDEAVEKLVR